MMQSKEQQDAAAAREGECGQCKWINGHRSWCSEFTLMSEDGRTAFLERLRDFTNAGHLLIEVWADADEVAPLPDRIKPPLSLDEWLMELSDHYAVALAEQITVQDKDEITEWAKDGDPCNDCGEAANYDPANGWYYHVDPTVPGCFLMGSGPIADGENEMIDVQNTRRGPARPANEQEAWRANAALARSYDAEEKTMAANETVIHKVHPTVLVPDEDLTDWEAAWANIQTLPFPVYDGTGCRWIDLGPQVYGLMDWDGEYRIGLYYNTEDGDDEGVCARFDDWASAEAFALRLCAAGVIKTKAEAFTMLLPYNLKPQDIVAEDLHPAQSVEDSLTFLLDEADPGDKTGERARIIRATAALLEKGVDLDLALHTAIIWERG